MEQTFRHFRNGNHLLLLKEALTGQQTLIISLQCHIQAVIRVFVILHKHAPANYQIAGVALPARSLVIAAPP